MMSSFSRSLTAVSYQLCPGTRAATSRSRRGPLHADLDSSSILAGIDGRPILIRSNRYHGLRSCSVARRRRIGCPCDCRVMDRDGEEPQRERLDLMRRGVERAAIRCSARCGRLLSANRLQAPELKTLEIDGCFDLLARKGVRRVLVGSDDADRMPGTKLIRQFRPPRVAGEGAQSLVHFRLEDIDSHGLASSWFV